MAEDCALAGNPTDLAGDIYFVKKRLHHEKKMAASSLEKATFPLVLKLLPNRICCNYMHSKLQFSGEVPAKRRGIRFGRSGVFWGGIIHTDKIKGGWTKSFEKFSKTRTLRWLGRKVFSPR